MESIVFIIAQIAGIVPTFIGIVSVHLKDIKKILAAQILANGLMAVSYILLGGDSGFWISVFAVIHSVINSLYQHKGKRPPWAVCIIFSAIYLACSILVWEIVLDILPACAAICFAFAIQQTKTKNFRLFSLVNSLFWVVYDIWTLAFTGLLCHGMILISTLTAIIRNKDFTRMPKE